MPRFVRRCLPVATLLLVPALASAQTTTDLGRDSATVTQRDGDDTATATVGRDGASAQQSVDCATDPENERCRRDSHASVDGSGVRFGLEQKSVRRVLEPPSSYASGSMDLGVIVAEGQGFDMFGGSIGLGVSGATGGQLPGAEGGGWSGVGYLVGGHAAFTSMSGDYGSTESFVGDLSAGLGFQYLSYGELDRTTLEQSGFGFFLGYTGGVFFTSETDPVGSHGPVLTLSMPTYNAGTAQVSSYYLSGMVLPLDSLTFVMVSLGGTVPMTVVPDPLPEGGACQGHAECRADLVCQAGRCAAPPGGARPGATPKAGAPGAAGAQAPPSGLPASTLPPADF